MQVLFSRALLLSWAIWLGGLIGVLLSVSTIFDALAPDRHAAGQIAQQIFKRADALALVFAAVSLIATGGLLLSGATKSRKAVFALLVFAALLALCTAAVIAPKIVAMSAAGASQTPEFKKLHGLSMVVALVEILTLAAAGTVLPAAFKTPAPTAAPTAAPAAPTPPSAQ